ncbi:MAG: hypothetical protein KAU20_07665 [Nanoarchaeota archaeon]|nr:hypothetical protein [Nanoarchaeota archaeon]
MKDICGSCICRGDFKQCRETGCSYHNSWIIQELLNRLDMQRENTDNLEKSLTIELYNIESIRKALKREQEISEHLRTVLKMYQTGQDSVTISTTELDHIVRSIQTQIDHLKKKGKVS